MLIDEPSISRRHVRLAVDGSDGAYCIQDLQSRNGTWLNGKRLGVQPAVLSNGDRIHLARTGVLLQFFTDEATVTQQAPLGAALPFLGPEAMWVSGRWRAVLGTTPWLRFLGALLGLGVGVLGLLVWLRRLLVG